MSDLLDGFRVGFDIFRPAIEAKLQKRRIKLQGKQDRKTAVTRGKQDRKTAKQAQSAEAKLQRKRLKSAETEGEKGRTNQLTMAQIQAGTTITVTNLKEMGLNDRQVKELQQKVLDRNQNKQLTEAQMSIEMYKEVQTDKRFSEKIRHDAKLAGNQITSNEKIAAGRDQMQRDISDAEISSREKLTELQLAQAERIEKMREANKTWSEINREMGLNKRQALALTSQKQLQDDRLDAAAEEGRKGRRHDRDMVKRTLRAEKSMHEFRLEHPDKTDGELMDLYYQERSLRYGELQDLMTDQSVPYKKRIEAYRRLHGMHAYDQQRQATAHTLADSGNVDGLIKYGDFLIGQSKTLKKWQVNPVVSETALEGGIPPSMSMHMARPAPRNIYSGGGDSTDLLGEKLKNSGNSSGTTTPNNVNVSPSVKKVQGVIKALPPAGPPPN